MLEFTLILGIALGLCGSTAAFRQNVPGIDIFGGCFHVQIDTNGLGGAGPHLTPNKKFRHSTASQMPSQSSSPPARRERPCDE
jgi:hypothetical protein